MSYRRLGDMVKFISNKNTDGNATVLFGINIDKFFMPSVANIIGVDLKKYKVVKKHQFACNRMHVGRDERLPISMSTFGYDFIVSPAYDVFEVITSDVLPEYLMLWFRRKEFDRQCWFYTDADVRGGLHLDALKSIEIKVPSIKEQREIVAQYQSIANKIKVNEQICEKLEATAQALYKHWFVDFEFPNGEGKPYKSSGGKMVWNEELGKEIPEGWKRDFLKNYCSIKGGKRLPKDNELNNSKEGRPYIRVADMNKDKFITLNSKFQYVSDEIQKSISRYIVEKDDVLISIVGTIGLVNIIDKSLHQANLTENCFKITNCKIINTDYLYHFLVSNDGQREIEMKTVGGVQAKLPMYNVELLDIVIPSENILKYFKTVCNKLNDHLINKKIELDKLTQLQSLLLSRLAVGEEEKRKITV